MLDTAIRRYASKEMQAVWTDQHKYKTWRQLWYLIAHHQQQLGVAISDDALHGMAAACQVDVDLEKVARYEKESRHDVMAHIRAMEDDAPAAKGVIHLGCTSCDITDNADLILINESLALLEQRLNAVIEYLIVFMRDHRNIPTLGWTHYQPAQLTTVGKRAALWGYDLFLDLQDVKQLRETLPFRGLRGATGTQASFLSLFNGDHTKVMQLEVLVASHYPFKEITPVCGQTYSRKLDSKVVYTVAGIGESCAKFGNDVRLLQHEGEIMEPTETTQVGSSAMAYKRNPMRCERMCSLARYLIELAAVSPHTAATQWLERTLDDSANRRLLLPQAFLLADGLLTIYANVASGLTVNERVIINNVRRELPFMATEEILMRAVKAGRDRQEVHELIRRESREVQEAMLMGGENDLLGRLEEKLGIKIDLDLNQFTGRAAQQVAMFIAGDEAQETLPPPSLDV
jgi:adenylosuccinate lyase